MRQARSATQNQEFNHARVVEVPPTLSGRPSSHAENVRLEHLQVLFDPTLDNPLRKPLFAILDQCLDKVQILDRWPKEERLEEQLNHFRRSQIVDQDQWEEGGLKVG